MRTLVLVCLLLGGAGTISTQGRLSVSGISFGKIDSVNKETGEVRIARDSGPSTYFMDLPAGKLNAAERAAADSKLFSRLVAGRWVSFQWIEEAAADPRAQGKRWIVGLHWLGSDKFSPLRQRLLLPEDFPIDDSETVRMPWNRSLKLFVDFEAEKQRTDYLKWVEKWNRTDAARHGTIEVVPTLNAADVALVTYRFDPVRPPKAGAAQAGDDADYAAANFMEERAKHPNHAVVLFVPKTDQLSIISFRLVEVENGRFEEDITKGLGNRLLESPSIAP